jgi:hypothetical protein
MQATDEFATQKEQINQNKNRTNHYQQRNLSNQINPTQTKQSITSKAT